MFRQPRLQKYISRIVLPDNSVRTDQDYAACARQYGRTFCHATGTCKMGQEDDMAVINPDLKVHSIKGLHICDSSVMPSLIGSNTNAPTIMIGEKGSDLSSATHALNINLSRKARYPDTLIK